MPLLCLQVWDPGCHAQIYKILKYYPYKHEAGGVCSAERMRDIWTLMRDLKHVRMALYDVMENKLPPLLKDLGLTVKKLRAGESAYTVDCPSLQRLIQVRNELPQGSHQGYIYNESQRGLLVEDSTFFECQTGGLHCIAGTLMCFYCSWLYLP